MSSDRDANQDSDNRPNANETGLASGEQTTGGPSRYLLFNAMPSWLVSFFLHIVLILLLAIVFLPDNSKPPISFDVSNVAGDQLESLDVNLEALDLETEMSSESLKTPEMNLAELPLPDVNAESMAIESPSDFSSDFIPSETNSLAGGGEFSGRSAEGRASALSRGATRESEQSVDLALEWLAKHQLSNGSWNFDHSIGPGERSKLNPGARRFSNCVNASTALAILPFLGAGHTHVSGEYRETVRKGLEFLRQNKEGNSGKISWWESEGTMYSHGLATIVFCEVYAMSGDNSFLELADGGIRYIEYAQDSRGGGWKYDPGVRGDTSVTGWQIMALKSAKMSGISIDEKVWKLCKKFLDFVSDKDGAFYGYEDKPGRPEYNKSRIAVGLLCRMYMGWEHDRPGLIDGVVWLSDTEPSKGTYQNPNGANMYYNYYATQVLKHYGGDMWTKWNTEMRDYLVEQQATEGNERGSWYFDRSDDLGPEAGGRLYCTAMAAMTLEVYYRFLPLYDNQSVGEDDDFPLD